MQLDLLTDDLLREILRRHSLSTRGTKSELTHHLHTATMPPTTPAASWNLYTEQRLDAFIAALGLDTTGITTKQEKTVLLEAVPGLTPNHALTAMMAPASNKVELQLTKQTATEKPEAFIARAKAHFQLVAPTDTEPRVERPWRRRISRSRSSVSRSSCMRCLGVDYQAWINLDEPPIRRIS
jgi:hypothetical protein